MPRVSVLLPVFNDASTLEAALASVRRQSISDWECVVVDDGSADPSKCVAARAAARDARIRVVARDHEGIVAALNHGLGHCTAPLVARMDADDWMHRDRLAIQAEALDRRPDWEAVGSHVRLFPRRSLRAGRRAYEAWLNDLSDATSVHRDRFIECPIAHPTLMIRRESLEAHAYRDRGWPEDYDLILRLLRQGPCIGMVPRRLLGWRDRPDRLSRTDARFSLERFTACRAWHLHRDFLSGHPHYVLWGHGSTGRSLRRALAVHGHHPTTIVDVHPRRVGNTLDGAKVVPPEWLLERPPYPIVVSVAGSGPRREIRAMLDGAGFHEGVDYMCAA